MIYLMIALVFGIAGGFVGRSKGSSFILWFGISALIPVFGLFAALVYRYETDELRRECSRCARVCMAYDAICVRCGQELEFPTDDEIIAPASYVEPKPDTA